MHSWARSSVLQSDSDEDENTNEQLSDITSNTADGNSSLGSQREERTESQERFVERRTQSTQPSSSASVSSVASEDTFEVLFQEKFRRHPNPGNGANKLNNLVNTAFRVHFGSSRVPSSRELEQQRAASSLKPFTPLLKDNEPELILGDTPFHSPTTIPTRVGQQQQQGTSQNQLQKRQPSSSIQQPPVQSKQQQQTTMPRFADRFTQTEQQQSSSQRQYRPPSPPCTPPRLPCPSPIQPRNPAAQQSDWRPRSLSISDFPPLYDLNHRPRVPPPINVDSWALGVGHYRRMHLDNLVKRIKEHEKIYANLEAKLSRFDKQNQQELDELGLMRREQELEVRRRQHEERLREQEELERRLAARTENLTAAPRQTAQFSRSNIGQNPPRPSSAPLHSILKKPLAPPPRSFSFPNANAAAGRVAFRSPIRSVNLYSPNRSGDNSSSMAPAADAEVQLENEPTCSQNIACTTTNNQQRRALPQKNASGLGNGRFVLTNQTNNANNNGNGHSGSSIGGNVQAGREREGNRMDYLNKWQRNRQQLEKAKRLNRRINLTSNPTSIFQYIPAHPT